MVKGLPGGLLDADLRDRTGHDARLDAERTQDRLERGRMDGAVVELLDLVFPGQRSEFIDDVGALLFPIDVRIVTLVPFPAASGRRQ